MRLPGTRDQDPAPCPCRAGDALCEQLLPCDAHCERHDMATQSLPAEALADRSALHVDLKAHRANTLAAAIDADRLVLTGCRIEVHAGILDDFTASHPPSEVALLHLGLVNARCFARTEHVTCRRDALAIDSVGFDLGLKVVGHLHHRDPAQRPRHR